MPGKRKRKHGHGILGTMLEEWERICAPDKKDAERAKNNAKLANLYLAEVLAGRKPATPELNAAARLAFQRAGAMPETEAKLAAVKGKADDGKLEVTVTFESKPISAD